MQDVKFSERRLIILLRPQNPDHRLIVYIFCFAWGIHLYLSCPLFFSFSAGDKVHCYCNSPRCVGYSYMCVSEYGCFSQVTADSSYSRGCVEDLVMIERCLQAEEETFKRLNKSLNKAEKTFDIGLQLLSCCYDDMCNYANYDKQEQMSNMNGNLGKWFSVFIVFLDCSSQAVDNGGI